MRPIPTDPMRQHEVLRGHDIGDAMDRLWANAALPRVTGLSQVEPQERLAPPGFDPISQEEDPTK